MNLVKRIIVYCIGLFFLALGVTLSIKSNLGVSPVSSLPYVISLISGYSTGAMITVMFSLYVGIQIVILGKNFKVVNLLQILFATIFGYFVNYTDFLVSSYMPWNYIVQLATLGVSIVFLGIGIVLYLKADVMPLPAEGLLIAVQTKTTMPFHNLKVSFDAIVVVLSIALSFVFMGQIVGIREGTVIAAILVGKCVGMINRIFSRQLHQLAIFMKLPVE
ncbi:MAG: DUF6198 family protein [Firmicutes bacterium]|jgi:uncharacterized membrane protein YczE|nr:DUF6198 family protein [Bacillota bacterium]